MNLYHPRNRIHYVRRCNSAAGRRRRARRHDAAGFVAVGSEQPGTGHQAERSKPGVNQSKPLTCIYRGVTFKEPTFKLQVA